VPKFKGRFRIDSTRLEGWSYSTSGWYFVTICTKDQVPFFGEVIEGEVVLSALGKLASRMWEEIPRHHSVVELDEFIIMPNHIHGVIIILPKEKGITSPKSVETLHATSVQPLLDEKMAEISPCKGSLSVIMRSYKSALTRWARQNGYEKFAWHPRYFDHIIRNEGALQKIRNYIQENPLKWELDRYYREGM
jgi:putative transposase